MKDKLTLIFLLAAMASFAQPSICNNKTSASYLQKHVPKDVCIPKGMAIDRIYSIEDTVDFNKDGYTDLVFAYSRDKKKLSDGDSSFLVFYTMNKDSTYTLFKKYDNVIPVYFDPNQKEVDVKGEQWNKILDCYQTLAPLLYMKIKADTVTIMRYLATIERKQYVFKFNPKLRDWELVEIWNLIGDHLAESLLVEPKQILSNFSYCDN